MIAAASVGAAAAGRVAAGGASRAEWPSRQLRRVRVGRRRSQRHRRATGFDGAGRARRRRRRARADRSRRATTVRRFVLGDDVLTAVDRGLAVAAFSPAGQLIGQWAFSLDEKPGVQLPPTPYVLRGESPCQVLRPGQPTDVGDVLADGGWWATVEGKGTATIAIDTGGAGVNVAASSCRTAAATASIDVDRSRVITIEPQCRARDRCSGCRCHRPPPRQPRRSSRATSPRCASVAPRFRRCRPRARSKSAPNTMAGSARAGTSASAAARSDSAGRSAHRSLSGEWRQPRRVRMLLRLRAANANGATIQASINGARAAVVRAAGGRVD